MTDTAESSTVIADTVNNADWDQSEYWRKSGRLRPRQSRGQNDMREKRTDGNRERSYKAKTGGNRVDHWTAPAFILSHTHSSSSTLSSNIRCCTTIHTIATIQLHILGSTESILSHQLSSWVILQQSSIVLLLGTMHKGSNKASAYKSKSRDVSTLRCWPRMNSSIITNMF